MTDGPTAFDWAARYEARNTPWDLGDAHPELRARLADGRCAPPRAGARALVPGCGRGHDAIALARAGWRVTAVDVVEAVGASLAETLGGHDSRFELRDALTFDDDEPYDLLLEHTFFCAIDRDRRADWGALVRRNLRVEGLVVVLLFPVGKAPELGGPPHGVDLQDYVDALGSEFTCLESGPNPHPVATRRWAEEIAVFRRDA